MPSTLMIEFATAEDLISATRVLRSLGFLELETFTPYQIPELEAELGLPRPMLIPFLALGAGVGGCGIAFVIVWFCNAYNYPLNVGGRPFNSIPADIPLMFETTVLFAGITAFALVLLLSGLPRLHHPVMDVIGFERASIDRFWIGVEHYPLELEGRIYDEMTRQGALSFERLGGASA